MRITAESLKEFEEIELKVFLLGASVQDLIESVSGCIGGGISVTLKPVYNSTSIMFSSSLKLERVEISNEKYVSFCFEKDITVYVSKEFKNSIYF